MVIRINGLLNMSNDELTVIEQKQVAFHDDLITAVRVEDGTIYVPVRPICNLLGVAWNAQFERIKRDARTVDLAMTSCVSEVSIQYVIMSPTFSAMPRNLPTFSFSFGKFVSVSR